MLNRKTNENTLDIPIRQGLNGYMMMFIAFNENLNTTLASPESFVEPMRIYYMVLHMISIISDKELREKAIKEMSEEMKNRGIDNENIDESERKHIQLEVSIMSIKYITEWIDMHVGLSVENRVGYS